MAVPVADALSDADIAALRAQPVDIIELRIDQFASQDVAHVQDQIKRYDGFALLATIRAAHEGGAWSGDDAERLALYQAIIESVDAVDVELSSEAIVGDVLQAARQAGKLTIASYHNFDATPDRSALDDIALDGMARGVDVVKIAAMPERVEDIQQLAAFALKYAAENVIAIAMGERGALSRVFFPALGSLITYASYGEAVAPGQLALDEQIAMLRTFYPDFGGV